MDSEGVIKSLNQAVAAATDSPYGEVATRFWQRLSINLQRSQHRAFMRWVGGNRVPGVWGSGFAFRSVHALEMPGGL